MKFFYSSFLSSTLLLGTALAQQPQTASQSAPAAQGAAASKQGAVTGSPTKITPEQAQKLFSSIDDVFQFVSRDTKLPIKHPVPKKLANRDEVQKYIELKMETDDDTKRFERSEVVLKKFGMVPREFELRPFLVKLLRDQVAGFYDAKTKTVYLLDWVDPEIQKPVMAHELTHALQDQNFDLEKWSKDTRRDDAEKAGDYNKAIEMDEQSTAETAMVEGQGMITYLDYVLRDYGRNAVDSPDIVKSMGATIENDKSSEVLQSAPMLLRESLIFPYRQGMQFVGSVLAARGTEAAFAGMFARPPRTSYEIMTPAAYLTQREIAPTPLPNVKALLGDAYTEYDLGSMGEFDTELMLKQFANPQRVAELTAQWDGGSYYAALRKRADPRQTSSIGLVYVSRWKTSAGASAFAKVYADSLRQKYRKLEVAECSPCEGGERRWNTEEGFVELDQRGNKIVVTEGLEQPLAVKLKEAVLEGGGEVMSAQAGELSLRVVPSWFRAMWGGSVKCSADTR